MTYFFDIDIDFHFDSLPVGEIPRVFIFNLYFGFCNLFYAFVDLIT